jgi:hypothetical protein
VQDAETQLLGGVEIMGAKLTIGFVVEGLDQAGDIPAFFGLAGPLFRLGDDDGVCIGGRLRGRVWRNPRLGSMNYTVDEGKDEVCSEEAHVGKKGRHGRLGTKTVVGSAKFKKSYKIPLYSILAIVARIMQ